MNETAPTPEIAAPASPAPSVEEPSARKPQQVWIALAVLAAACAASLVLAWQT